MRLPSLKPAEVIFVLKKLGFIEKRQTGAHKIFYHPTSKKIVVVPTHTRDIKRGLLRAIVAQLELKPNDFLMALRKK
ncbi:MAG: type II toxin-antitoxin system HicA family toxin [candidate division WOR-3 bacterium]